MKQKWKETIMKTKDRLRASPLIVAMVVAACCGATLSEALAEGPEYTITTLSGLGGASDGGNSINDRTYVAGYSNKPDNMRRHAVLWRNDASHTLVDLGTLGGPNSSVIWPNKDTKGIIIGISQTATPDTSGEIFSSGYFYPGPKNTGYVNRAFAFEKGKMRGLPTLGGIHGFGSAVNNRGMAVGWAENTCVDGTCVPPQIYQFRPVHWNLKNGDKIGEFPLFDSSDTSGAATAINDADQAVGITGICDQAIGRYTAKHAVLWEKGSVTDLGNLGADFWNTPTAISQNGTVVGFAGVPGFPEGDFLHAFVWTKTGGIQPLDPLPGDLDSEAYGINSSGTVVGVSCDAEGVCKGVRWDDGVVTDLNSVKPAEFTDRIETAKDINDRGEITGRAISDAGVRTSYLAVPTDE